MAPHPERGDPVVRASVRMVLLGPLPRATYPTSPAEPMTSREASPMTDFLLSWDRLGFRLLAFGGLAAFWVLQGRMLGEPWISLIRSEVAGLMPWVFLSPIVLAVARRAPLLGTRPLRLLGWHFLGMALVLVPYWAMQRGVFFSWALATEGWKAQHLRILVPTRQNMAPPFINTPFIYLLVLLGTEAMRHARARQEEVHAAQRLAGQLSEARLSLLQRQLHPHFLFNALQAISTLLHRDPRMADGLLVRLSTLLRIMLDQASGQTLSLRTELELTRKYLDIEQVRFADRLAVAWEVDEALLEVQVPSLVLLPLVENAIRHGLSPKVGPGRLAITAVREGDALLLKVEDDGLGAASPLRPGVGLGNTHERLRAMYGRSCGPDVETLPEGGFRAVVRLPLPEVQS